MPYWRVKNLKVKIPEPTEEEQKQENEPTEEEQKQEETKEGDIKPKTRAPKKTCIKYVAQDDGEFPGIEIVADKQHNKTVTKIKYLEYFAINIKKF